MEKRLSENLIVSRPPGAFLRPKLITIFPHDSYDEAQAPDGPGNVLIHHGGPSSGALIREALFKFDLGFR